MAEVMISVGIFLAKALAICAMLAGCVAIYLVESCQLNKEV